MKDSVTRFNFDDAFKALDEIEIPVAEKGIRANRVDLKESMKRVDKFELLFEDFYDVNNTDDMNAVSEEREAEVAKAKLARIEKIVDLDAETEDDILPSYVGKTIIQCPQCMTLFYKNAEDIVRDEENPDVVNVNEVCQHCGNESGYDVVGKVAEETEAAPGDELGTDDFSAEVGDGENDIAIDDGSETTEEVPAEEGGEVDELSAEADLDSLDLDAELDLEEEPVEEEEEANESLNTSKLLKKIEDKNELKTENESEKLTLNEDAELNKQLDLYNDFIKYLQKMVEQDEEALERAKKQGNKEVIAAIQKRLDNSKAELEAALPETVKDEADTEELPDATEAGMEDATDNTSDETEEEVTEALNESCSLESLSKQLDTAIEQAEFTAGIAIENTPGQGTIANIKKWGKEHGYNLVYFSSKENAEELADKFYTDEKMKRPNTVAVLDEFDKAPEYVQKRISGLFHHNVVAVIIITNDKFTSKDPLIKTVIDCKVETETEKTTEGLTEAVKIVDNNDWWVDYRPAFEAIAKEVDGKFDFAVNFNVYNEKIIMETSRAIEKDELAKVLDAMTNSKVAKENKWTAVYTGLENNQDNMIKIQFEYAALQHKDLQYESLTEDVSMTSSPENFKTLLGTKEFKKPISQEEVESYFESVDADLEDAVVTVEGDTDPVSIDYEDEDDALQEAGGFGMFSSISGSLAKIIKDLQYQYLYIVPFISGTDAQEYFRANRALDNGGKYNAQPYRFPVLEAGNGLKYPVALNTTPINHTADVKAIETSIKTIVKDIDKKLKTLNKVTARTFVDIVGGNAINPRGHVYQIDGGKGIKLTTVLLIGSKQQLPASKMSTGYFDTESNCNNFINFCKNHYLLQSVNEKITANKNAVANAKNNQSGGTDEDRAQQMLTDAVEKFAEYEAKYVYVVSSSDDKLQDNTKSIIGDDNKKNDDKFSDIYKNLAEQSKANSGITYYLLGSVEELKLDDTTLPELAANDKQLEAYTIATVQNGNITFGDNFTGKPVAEAETPVEDGKGGEGGGEAGGGASGGAATLDTFFESDKVKPNGEGNTALVLVASAKTNYEKDTIKVQYKAAQLIEADKAKNIDAYNKLVEEAKKQAAAEANALPQYVFGILFVKTRMKNTDGLKDDTIADVEKKYIMAAYDSTGAEVIAPTIPTLTESFNLNVSDIDESGFNKQITESLKNVYQNVKKFTMTNCTLDGTKLVLEGLITFNSGKFKNTSYVFEARKGINEGFVTLSGYNKDLFENGKIKIATKVLNETLYAKSLRYNYYVGDKLVEGLVRK